ncbi:hypothetical protein EC844_101157 [Acinetobacter calcoaceticus]|uniref:Lipoprotein n=1 Tax=Acinetobacter calcoaceticus TaxID=471 RepID=A0A4R1YA57_ACICA|nr:hypothetical protein EC844_101157 [Acinetobacter calcoaceticus]
MRLKHLTLCLLGLSLSACSTYSVKNQTQPNASLEQKAASGLNAMFSYPSYDFNGRFQLAIDAEPRAKQAAVAAKLDPLIEKRVEDYLKTQKIQLGKQQKQDLYHAIAKENAPGSSIDLSQFNQMVTSMLEGTEFSYNGSVHYRQKMASLNFNYKYQAPNMKTEATIPMMVDFNQHRFYINYAGLVPYFVSKENQNRFAYVDFSKYKDKLNQVDYKNLINFLKQNSAVPYVLADQKQLTQVKLSSQDQANGMVEKLRLDQSFEALVLQQLLYAVVNKGYLSESVFKEDPSQTLASAKDDVVAEASKTEQEEAEDYSDYGYSQETVKAYQASSELYRLVEAHLYPEQAEEEEADEAETEELAAQEENEAGHETARADEATAAAEDTEVGLEETECSKLSTSSKTVRMGDIGYCKSEYGIDVFAVDQDVTGDKPDKIGIFDLFELVAVFEKYDTKQFVDAEAFKVLWLKHADEINAALAKQKTNPMRIDVGLDQQGRAIKVDYAIDYHVEKYGRIKFNTDLNILNYGNATAISKKDIQEAKTFKEMSKGSIFEDLTSSMSAAIGLADGEASPRGGSKKSFDEQLADLAADTYRQTQSYTKTFQAVYIMKLSMEQPKVVQHYTAQQLNEIARVYAYSYADESIYNPQGRELAELERLIKVHHLEKREHYDEDMGESVYDTVETVIDDQKKDQEWNDIVKQYKQPKTAFAQYYIKKFLAENDVEPQQLALLTSTANILAQTYLDRQKNALTAKSVAALTLQSEDFIDYDLYRVSYEKTLKHFK